MLIDSHCHLESFHRQNRLDEALAAANTNGVGEVVTVGTGPDDWPLYRSLATSHPGRIHWTAGLHPGAVEDGWEAVLPELERLFQTVPRPCALGEVGLDNFHLPKEAEAAERTRTRQLAAFQAQLELARRLDCPVVIHSRHAFAECVAAIDTSGIDWRRVVFHCFGGGPEEIAILNRRGGRGSFTGIITYKNARSIADAAVAQGLDRLMIETDAPYLTPVPHRGKPNQPAFLRHTAEFCAGLFNIQPTALAECATASTRRFYDLPAP